MSSLFTKIIKNEIPSFKIYENDKVCAFLDAYPKQLGHTLIIPKIEIADFFELEASLIDEIMRVATMISNTLKLSVNCKKIALLVEGLEVPHAHLHLIPINEPGDICCGAKHFTTEDMVELQKQIITNLELQK
jgi:histidine triad (HIT) family protein